MKSLYLPDISHLSYRKGGSLYTDQISGCCQLAISYHFINLTGKLRKSRSISAPFFFSLYRCRQRTGNSRFITARLFHCPHSKLVSAPMPTAAQIVLSTNTCYVNLTGGVPLPRVTFWAQGGVSITHISKVPFEIPHKISYPYIERYDFYTTLKF